MASLSTKCPYCRRRYQQAAASEKHLEAIHHDILLSLRGIVDTTLQGLRAFAPDENSHQCDSDYKSDPMLEIADCFAASNDPSDINMIGTRRTFPSRRTVGAHPVKKVSQTLAEHPAMLLAIGNFMRLR